MIKILYIHHAVGWGGAPINMINIIKSLDPSIYDAHVLLLKDSVVSKKLREEGISYSIAQSSFYKKYYKYFSHTEPGYTPGYSIFRVFMLSIFWFLSHLFFAHKELKRFQADIIQLNSSVLTDWLKAASKISKTILHVQEPFRVSNINLRSYFFRFQIQQYADHVIAISKDNATRINIPNKTTVIYNYADVPKEDVDETSYSSKSFLYLGGMAKIKGFKTMVEALDYLDDGVKIWFGGNYGTLSKKRSIFKRVLRFVLRYGKQQEALVRKMRSHSKSIEIGMINDVSDYMQRMCALVSPFAVSHFSRPVIEAYLHKKGVIVSDVKGMEEIVKPEEYGIIVPKNNAKVLAQAINRLASSSELSQSFGQSAYPFGLRHFTVENERKFTMVYQKLLR